MEQLEAQERIRPLLSPEATPGALEALLDELDAAELVHAFYLLDPDEQRALLSRVTAEFAADLVGDLPDAHVADLIEEMPAREAAPIV